MNALDLVIGAAGLGLILLPGWWVARAAGLPQPAVAGFVAGIVALHALIQAATLAGFPLDRPTLAAAWTALCAAAFVFARRLAAGRPAAADDAWPPPSLSWLMLPVVPVFAVAAWRTTAHPLFGVDTVFRWDFLAVRLLERGSLDFYPPVTPADFELYSWPDAIAPTASALYFAVYALAGEARPLLTAPAVLFQFFALLLAVVALTGRLFGPRAAAFAGALIAASPILVWSATMGHETGLLALGVVALLLYLPAEAASSRPALVVAAGLAAALAALAREYGLVFPVLGLALVAARRLPRRHAALFAAAALLLPLAWHLRNALRTGNPFSNLALGDLLPVNVVHRWLQDSFAVEFGWSGVDADDAVHALSLTGLAVAAAVAGLVAAGRRAPAVVALLGVSVGLWLLSLPHTAAGFTGSLRVLAPALALAAALGGAALDRWLPAVPARPLAAVAALALVGLDSALRSLVLPATVYRLPPSRWLEAGGAIHAYHAQPVYDEIVRLAGAGRILALGPNALLARRGGRTVPLWSPEVAFLFDPAHAPAEVARRLRARGIDLLALNRGPVNERFLARSAYFRDPGDTLRAVWSGPDLVVLRLHP